MNALMKGSDMKLSGSILVASIIVTAVWYQVNIATSTADEEVPEWKTQGFYVLAAVSVLLTVPVVWGLFTQSRAGSSFSASMANASSNLRESLEEGEMPASQDFEARVSAAASKLREQIGKSSATVVDYPVHQPTASSLAAQASAEIDRFIADNS